MIVYLDIYTTIFFSFFFQNVPTKSIPIFQAITQHFRSPRSFPKNYLPRMNQKDEYWTNIFHLS